MCMCVLMNSSSIITTTDTPLSKALISTCCCGAAESQTDQTAIVLVAAMNECEYEASMYKQTPINMKHKCVISPTAPYISKPIWDSLNLCFGDSPRCSLLKKKTKILP